MINAPFAGATELPPNHTKRTFNVVVVSSVTNLTDWLSDSY